MRNFMGNPFLMVTERSGHAKLVKTSKNQFFHEILNILEVEPHLESRTTPDPTVGRSKTMWGPTIESLGSCALLRIEVSH